MSINSVQSVNNATIAFEQKVNNGKNLAKIMEHLDNVLVHYDYGLKHYDLNLYRALQFDNNYAKVLYNLFTRACETKQQAYYLPKMQVEPFPIVSQSISAKALRKCFKNFIQKTVDTAAQKYGVTIENEKFQFTHEDIQKYKISNPKEIARKYDCSAYALHLLKEPLFEKALYSRVPKDGQFADILHILRKQLHYDDVLCEPQKGDAIFYMDRSGRPEHMGIFLDPNTVTSKWGDFPQIFIHDLESCPYAATQLHVVLRKKTVDNQ